MSDAPAATVPVAQNDVPPANNEAAFNVDNKIYVGNIPRDLPDDEYKAFFGDLQSHIVATDFKPRGPRMRQGKVTYGFVTMDSQDAAQKALSFSGKELQGFAVKVQLALTAEEKAKKPRRQFRRTGRRGAKAVPGEVTDAEANGQASSTEATPDDGAKAAPPKKKKKKPARKSKAATEGEVTDAAAAPSANEDGTEAAATSTKKARRQRKPRASSRSAGKEPDGLPSETMLFVANLKWTVDDAALGKYFSDKGFNVKSARVIRNSKTERSKGFGFVEVSTKEERDKAINAADDTEFDTRRIIVKVAIEPTEPKDETDKDKAEAVNGDAAPTAAAPPA